MSKAEFPLDPGLARDLEDALYGAEMLPPNPYVVEAEAIVRQSKINQNLRYEYDRVHMHQMKPPTLSEMLGCLAIPLGAIAASAIVLRKLYKLKNK